MFAIAIFDPNDGTLLLARDPFGMKPLYYTEDWSGCFAFSSEVRPLLDLPWARKRLDPIGLLGYLSYGAVQEPSRWFPEFNLCGPAHMITIGLGRKTPDVNEPERYWRMPVRTVRANGFDSSRAAAHVRRAAGRIGGAAHSQRRAIAAFLSGGVDSSAITR